MTPDQPTATATPRTDFPAYLADAPNALLKFESMRTRRISDMTELWQYVAAQERELAEAKAEVARLKARHTLRYEAQNYHEMCNMIWRALDDKPDKDGNPCHVSLINQRDQLRARVAELEKLYAEERAQNPTLVHRLIEDERDQLQRKVAELEAVGRELYLAGFWESRTLSVGEQVRLWVKFREALGLPAGTATAQAKGQP